MSPDFPKNRFYVLWYSRRPPSSVAVYSDTFSKKHFCCLFILSFYFFSFNFMSIFIFARWSLEPLLWMPTILSCFGLRRLFRNAFWGLKHLYLIIKVQIFVDLIIKVAFRKRLHPKTQTKISFLGRFMMFWYRQGATGLTLRSPISPTRNENRNFKPKWHLMTYTSLRVTN